MSGVSVSSAASSAVNSTQQSPWAQVKSLWDQLGQALQAGDLAGAQKAFAALQANAPQGAASQAQGAAAQNGQGGSSQNPLSALASALQSGNLAAAQQAFSQVQQTQGHHHHHHHGSQSSSSTSTAAPSDAATSSTNSGNVTININGGNNIIA
jgi:hypothetical protein